ncbi:hypothetical protein [Thalassobacillus sp. CUG 92003]|uniref:hypothetical protein n=1 Tax=Thalassobacillus sp. CUG 92003 TaxID=2736641 RepID=UPI0015E72B8E|nr:hypothetical protein [Thalassobacillus sp. CUG 92003]
MTANYNEKLNEQLTKIKHDTKSGLLTREERAVLIDRATQEYALAHAEHIDSLNPDKTPIDVRMRDEKLLDQLSDLMLDEELRDPTAYKIANAEYPFMSDRMIDKRTSKDTKDTAIDKESERVSRGTRRQRTKYENSFMDRRHKAHNKAMRKRYNDFIKGRTEGVLNVVIKEEE